MWSMRGKGALPRKGRCIQEMADVVVILILASVLALIVRGMRRGSVSRCDGACGSCSHACSPTGIRLTEEQRAQLARIDERREQSI